MITGFLIFVATIVLWIWALIGVAQADDLPTGARVIWAMIIILLPLIGSIAWLVIRGRK